jgi:hypothetical protein
MIHLPGDLVIRKGDTAQCVFWGVSFFTANGKNAFRNPLTVKKLPVKRQEVQSLQAHKK